jgi:mitochondrial chaperone BCS1
MASKDDKNGTQQQVTDTASAPPPEAQSPPPPPPPAGPLAPGPPSLFSAFNQDSLAHYPNPFYSLQSGYNLIIYIVKHFLGFDPGFIINLSIFLAGLSTVGRYATFYLYHYVKKWITASTRIHEDEILLYHDVLRFMSEKWLKNRVFQDVKASTYGYVGIGEDSDDEADEADETDGDESEDESFDDDSDSEKPVKYYNFKARSAVRFQPYELSRLFYYKRNVFYFRHSLRVVASSNPVLGHRQSGELTLECLGRSLEPIRSFLEDAQDYCEKKSTQTTSIFRANGANWMLIGRRPSRDINTVILEKTKKRRLLRDMHEYISPSTKKWYANHG